MLYRRLSNGKVPVFGWLKRGGKVYTAIIPDAKASTLIPIIREKVYFASADSPRNGFEESACQVVPAAQRLFEFWGNMGKQSFQHKNLQNKCFPKNFPKIPGWGDCLRYIMGKEVAKTLILPAKPPAMPERITEVIRLQD